MLQNVVDQCKNVAKCCWSVLTSAKLKWGSWSRSLAGPWLAKHYLPYKICIFSCSTFSHYLFTDNPCFAPQIQAAVQKYILMFLCRFGFSMIKIKRPKLNHRNEKKRWIWARQLKSIAVGVWVQGWPLLTESSIVSRWGRWKMGEGVSYPILFLSRPQPGSQNSMACQGTAKES